MAYYYIDESGDLGKSSKYFIIGGISTNNPKNLNNIINKVNRKFKKGRKSTNEIKGNITPNHIIENILKKIDTSDYTTFALVCDKNNFYKLNYSNNNELYNLLSSYLASIISIDSKSAFYIDKSKNKQKDIENFNEMFKNNLTNKKRYPITIDHVSSINYKPLQIADLVVWSYFQYYENKNPQFKKLFNNTIIKIV